MRNVSRRHVLAGLGAASLAPAVFFRHAEAQTLPGYHLDLPLQPATPNMLTFILQGADGGAIELPDAPYRVDFRLISSAGAMRYHATRSPAGTLDATAATVVIHLPKLRPMPALLYCLTVTDCRHSLAHLLWGAYPIGAKQ